MYEEVEENMEKLLKLLSYILVATVASCVTMVVCVGTVNKSKPEPNKLDQVWKVIDVYYIDEADKTAAEDAAADAMVQSIGDRWSYYANAETYQMLLEQKDNSYVGIGITIATEPVEQGLRVLSVTKGSPAEEAGVLAGDVLTHAAGQSVLEIGMDAARSLIRGEEGTFVEIGILRGEAPMTLSVERRYIMTPVVTSAMLPGDIGYIRIVNFNLRSDTEAIEAVKQLKAQGAKGLIFDVRNNPGGYKDLLVKLLDYLLPEGPLFRSEDYTGAVKVDESGPDCVELPMAVLVNQDSYSAAEFFAAALSEYDAAVVVGEPTTGKGHFQMTFELDDGSAINLSVGRYTTPNGVNLDGVGITPDIVVPVDEETAALIYADALPAEKDPQIQAALDALCN